MTTPDPFACIPNSGDDEYANTILETPQQRERRAAAPDPAREIGRKRAAELLSDAGDENWLGA